MRKMIISLVGTVIVFAGIVWASMTSYTGEVAKITELNHVYIKVENKSGRVRIINASAMVINLLDINEEYFIEYKKHRWSDWKLTNIESIENK